MHDPKACLAEVREEAKKPCYFAPADNCEGREDYCPPCWARWTLERAYRPVREGKRFVNGKQVLEHYGAADDG